MPRTYHVAAWRQWILPIFLVPIGITCFFAGIGGLFPGIVFLAVSVFYFFLTRTTRLTISPDGIALKQLGWSLDTSWSNVERYLPEHKGWLVRQPLDSPGAEHLRALRNTRAGSRRARFYSPAVGASLRKVSSCTRFAGDAYTNSPLAWIAHVLDAGVKYAAAGVNGNINHDNRAEAILAATAAAGGGFSPIVCLPVSGNDNLRNTAIATGPGVVAFAAIGVDGHVDVTVTAPQPHLFTPIP